MSTKMKATNWWQFVLVILLIGKINCTNFVWVGGSECVEWSPSSSPACFNPAGYPSSSDTLSVPSNTILEISVPENYTGTENGFQNAFFSYGPSSVIYINSFVVSSNSILIINSYVSLNISSPSSVLSQGIIYLNGTLAAIGGSGNLSVAGNLTINGGNVQGTGELIIEKGASLNLLSYDGNYLLRNTSVYGNMISSGVTHTGFWWQPGSVLVQIFGNLTINQAFYDWEENGGLYLGREGVFNYLGVELRGISLMNDGTMIMGSKSSDLFVPLSRPLYNSGLILTIEGTHDMLYPNPQLILNDNGIFYASGDLNLDFNLNDTNGIFVADHSNVIFQYGTEHYSSYCCRSYYPPEGATYSYYYSYYATINLNQTTITSKGTSGAFSFNNPFNVIENLFIVQSYVNFYFYYYEYSLALQGNIIIDDMSTLNLQSGTIIPTSDNNNDIVIDGELEISGVFYLQTNIELNENGNLTIGEGAHLIYDQPNNGSFVSAIYVGGNFTIEGNFTSKNNIYLLEGGLIFIASTANVQFQYVATIYACGGTFTNNNGHFSGNLSPCPNGFLDNQNENIENNHFDDDLENGNLNLVSPLAIRKQRMDHFKMLLNEKKQNIHDRLSSFPILQSLYE